MIYGWQFVGLYFIASLIASAIFLAIAVNRPSFGKLSINNEEEVLVSLLFVIFWPLSIPGVSIAVYASGRAERIKEKGRNIINRYNMERMSPHDRTAMIEIPESDLKFLLKWRREKYLDYPKQILELVRDELMHRNAERDLLK